MAMTHDYLDHLNENIAIAPANSQEELQAAQVIAELMAQHHVEPQIEEFDAPAGAGIGVAVLSIAMFAGIVLVGVGILPLTVIGFLLAIVPAALAVARSFGHDINLAPGSSARSQNVVAVHRAEGPLVTKGSRRIVIVAHYDTPHENFLYSSAIAPYLPLITKVARWCRFVVAVCALVQVLAFLPGAVRLVFWIVGILAAAPSVLLAVGTIAERMSPCTLGTIDNKSSVAALLGVLENVRPSGMVPKERPVIVESEEDDAEDDVYANDSLMDDFDLVDEAFSDLGDEVATETDGGGLGVAPAVAAGVAPVAGATLAASADEAAATAPDPAFVQSVLSAADLPADAAAEGVRHGENVLRSLGMLPEDCQIEYARPVVHVPVAIPVAVPVPVEITVPQQTTAEPAPEQDFSGEEYEEFEGSFEVEDEASFEPLPEIPRDLGLFANRDKSDPFEGLPVAEYEVLTEEELAARAEAAAEAAAADDVPSAEDAAAATALEDEAAELTAAETGTLTEEDLAAAADADASAPIPAAATAPFEPVATAADAEQGELDSTRSSLLSTGEFALNLEEESRSVGPKDSSGIISTAALDAELDALAPAPEPRKRPEAPADPEWGKSGFRPQLSNMARRASLFDLPDPSAAGVDPFDTDPSATRVQPSKQQSAEDTVEAPEVPVISAAAAPSPVTTIGANAAGGKKKPGFLDRLLGRNASADTQDSWLGDDEDDSTTWKGGAARRSGLRLVEDDEVPTDEELQDAALSLENAALLAHDIWFVALGSSSLDHAGMRAFLKSHRSDVRGCFVVNLDSIGAGDLTVLTHEGLEQTRRADRRLVRLLANAADDLHIDLGRKNFSWTETDATPAMRRSMRAATIMGIDENGLPAYSHTPADYEENLDMDQAARVAQIVTEMIRRS